MVIFSWQGFAKNPGITYQTVPEIAALYGEERVQL